jgi:hypothetical protein
MSDTPIYDALHKERYATPIHDALQAELAKPGYSGEATSIPALRSDMIDEPVGDTDPDTPDVDSGDPLAADNEPEYVDPADPGVEDITVNDEFVAPDYTAPENDDDAPDETDPLDGAE